MGKQKIAIIGAGGFGRETALYIQDINKITDKWELVGFIDDNPHIDASLLEFPVLGSIESAFKMYNDALQVVCAVGSPAVKYKLVQRAKQAGFKFFNVIHPTAYIASNVSLGNGNIIAPYTMLTSNVAVGNHVGINPQCGIGHDVVIKDYCTLYWNVNLSGNVVLEEGCELGTKTTIIQGKSVGQWARTGAGSVVIDHIPQNCTAVGVPARPVKFHSNQF